MQQVAGAGLGKWQALDASRPDLSLGLVRPGKPPRQGARQARRRIRAQIILPIVFFCLTMALGFALFSALRPVIDGAKFAGWLEAAATSTGFAIEQVDISGQRVTADADIFDALDLVNNRLMFGFDSSGAKARIERLAWVQSADVKRLYPGRIAVRVTERVPVALWQWSGRTMLIDATGRELSAADSAQWKKLPKVSGAGAASEAHALFDLLRQFTAVSDRFVAAERVGERRWSLQLKDRVVVHLPAEGEAGALARLSERTMYRDALRTPGAVIDLRIAGRNTVRVASSKRQGGAR